MIPKHLQGKQYDQRCVYCSAWATAYDHLLPKSRGGTDDESNLVPACHRCNSSKHDRTLIEWDITHVLYGVSQDNRVFMEILRLANRYDLIKSDLTTIDRVRIASRLMKYHKRKQTNFVIELVIEDVKAKGYTMTLHQICDWGIIPIGYSTATRARSRAGNTFPMGKDSPNGILYRPGEVRAWFEARKNNKTKTRNNVNVVDLESRKDFNPKMPRSRVMMACRPRSQTIASMRRSERTQNCPGNDPNG